MLLPGQYIGIEDGFWFIGLASLKLGNLFTSDAIMIRVFGNSFNKDDIFIKIPTFRPYCNLSLAKLESELPR